MVFRKLLHAALALSGLLWTPLAGLAQCSSLVSQHTAVSGTIGLVLDDNLNPRVLKEAIELWRACDNYGVGFPAFRQGREATTRRIVVEYQLVRTSAGPGKRCGWFSGNTITLFGYVMTAKGPRHCGSLAHNLAHELGHVLGLVDAPDTPACATHIMADLTPANLFHRFVRQEECRILESRWLAWAEPAER